MKARGMHSTALTKLLLDNDFEIVKENAGGTTNHLDAEKMECQ